MNKKYGIGTKKRDTIRREYNRVEELFERLRKEENGNPFGALFQDKIYERYMLYGARQALGWMMNMNCMKASECVSEKSKRKRV